MEKKKVLVWETLPTVSGGQKMTLTVMDMLREYYDFVCLIPSKGLMSEELDSRHIPYRCMGNQNLPTGVKGKSVIFRYGMMSLLSIWKSLKYIRYYKPDILYAPGPAALPWSAICEWLSHKPVIWHLHHIFLDSTTKKLLNFCGKWKSVQKIIAVSHCVGNQITNPEAKQKVHVLYNPVDIEKYANGKPEIIWKELDEKLGSNQMGDNMKTRRPWILGHVALIQRTKKQDFVLNLIERLNKSGQETIAVYAGECRENDYLDYLQYEIGKRGIKNKIVFLGRRNDIPNVLKSLDVLIIPSFEGFPLVGLEAASAGIPIVACNKAGAREFIEVSHAGVSYQDGDQDAAENAIRQVIQDRQIYSANGRAFVSSLTNGDYQTRIEQIFKSVK